MVIAQQASSSVLAASAPARLCPACGSSDREFAPGPGGRPGARCSRCGALERHRFLAALLHATRDRIDGRLVLDIAPSPTVNLVLAGMSPARHLRVDFDPSADGRPVDVQASLTALPLPDRSVDTMLCYHVLEHIPDDTTAMREIARVLRTDGLAYIQVPFRVGAATDEDPEADEAERIRRFGQADHVRYYGEDFESRMSAAGLRFVRLDPADVVGNDVAKALNVGTREFVWLAWPAAGAAEAPVQTDSLSRAVLGHLVLFWGARSAEQGSTAEDLRGRVTKLRSRVRRAERELAAAKRDANISTKMLARRLAGRLTRRAVAQARSARRR